MTCRSGIARFLRRRADGTPLLLEGGCRAKAHNRRPKWEQPNDDEELEIQRMAENLSERAMASGG